MNTIRNHQYNSPAMRDTSLDSSEEARGLVRAGRAAIRLGDYQAAVVAFGQAVALDAGSLEAQEGLAEARRRLGVAQAERPVDAVEYCYRHPDRETGLHCVSCDRPICAQCSYPGAVGQLCPECRKGRRSVNYQVNWLTLVKAGAAAVVAGAVGTFVASFIGFFVFFLAPAIGEGVLRVVDWATRNKRGRAVQIVVAIGLIVGAGLLRLYQPVPLFSIGIFLLLSVGTAVARLR